MKVTKEYLAVIDPVDAEDRHEGRGDAARGRRDREFLVQRSRFLAALKICPKICPDLVLAKTTTMRVLINATGCPAPVFDRTSSKA